MSTKKSISSILFLGLILLIVGCTKEKKVVAMDSDSKVLTKLISPQPHFPNSRLPVVVFKRVTKSEDPENIANLIQSTFYKNGWRNSWRNGLYTFHHYHSNTHEALGIYRGWVEVQLGGPAGDIVKLEQGDVVIIPAGVSHKNVNQSNDFSILGAYPNSLSPNMRYGKEAEDRLVSTEIEDVPLPPLDPFFGQDGKLLDLWK